MSVCMYLQAFIVLNVNQHELSFVPNVCCQMIENQDYYFICTFFFLF